MVVNIKPFICKLSFILAGLLLPGAVYVYADEVRLSVSAPSEVAPGARFNISYSVNARPDGFQAPSFSPFRLISGPSQSSSTSTQIINNQVTTSISVSYTYTLEAPTEGTYVIPPAQAEINGQSYTSEAAEIRVTADAATRATPSPARPADQPTQTGTPDSDDIFIRAIADNTSPFQGEQVIIRYLLYTRLPITNYSIETLPSYQGLWHENISGSGQHSVSTETLNGQTYNVAEIRRVAVFPQRSGEIRIEPIEVEMSVRMRAPQRPGGRSFFDDFFSGTPFDAFQSVRHAERSNAVVLNVRPLPVQGRPAQFHGLVGRFTMSGELNQQSLAVNDAANLIIRIDGRGNLRLMDQPEITFPPLLDIFDPQITDQINTGPGGITGTKTFDYLIIPRQPGQADIPGVEFSFFDPEQEEYVTLSAGPFELEVTGEAIAGRGEGWQRSDIQSLAEDILFIYTKPVRWRPANSLFYKSTGFYLLTLLPVLVFVVFIIIWFRYTDLRKDQQLLKTRQARKVARKRLINAEKFMKNGDKGAFYDEVFMALWGFVSDRLNIPVAKLNKDNVTAAFENRQIPVELAKRFLEGLEECEFARFSPAGQMSPMHETYEKAMETIVNIEKKLRNQSS